MTNERRATKRELGASIGGYPEWVIMIRGDTDGQEVIRKTVTIREMDTTGSKET
jgi:hypothetical protein